MCWRIHICAHTLKHRWCMRSPMSLSNTLLASCSLLKRLRRSGRYRSRGVSSSQYVAWGFKGTTFKRVFLCLIFPMDLRALCTCCLFFRLWSLHFLCKFATQSKAGFVSILMVRTHCSACTCGLTELLGERFLRILIYAMHIHTTFASCSVHRFDHFREIPGCDFQHLGALYFYCHGGKKAHKPNARAQVLNIHPSFFVFPIIVLQSFVRLAITTCVETMSEEDPPCTRKSESPGLRWSDRGSV